MNLRHGSFIKTTGEEVLCHLGAVVIDGTTNLICCSVEDWNRGINLATIFVQITKVEIIDYVFPEQLTNK